MGQTSSRKDLVAVQMRSKERIGVLKVDSRYHVEPRILEDDYIVSKKVLGRGFNGSVFLAKSKHTTQAYAVKQFKLGGITKESREDLCTEVEISLCLDHPHVVRLVDVYVSKTRLSLVMECMEGGELFTRLSKQKSFTEFFCADLAWQMLLALNYLHQKNIVHRDLKLQNFLFESNDTNYLKLIDFGFSKIWKPNHKMALACGTLAYVAPEVLDENYTSQCDLWSFGVCVYAILCGSMPFKGSHSVQMERIKKGSYQVKDDIWSQISQTGKSFIQNLLVVDPSKRLTTETALAHPWIAQRQHHDNQAVSKEIAESLHKFAEASKFRRACLSVMAWSLTAKEQDLVREAFEEMDTDNSGTVTIGEFKRVLDETFHIADDECTLAFRAVDIHHDEEIHYNDFLTAMLSSRIAMHDEVLLSSFQRFDLDGSGYITVDELKQMLAEQLQENDIATLFENADVSHDGKIDYQEWIEYIRDGDVAAPVLSATVRHIDHKLKEKPLDVFMKPLRAMTRLLSSQSHTKDEKNNSSKPSEKPPGSCCIVS